MAAGLWTDLFARTNDPLVKNTVLIKEITDYNDQLDAKINRKLREPEDWRG